MTGSNQAPGHLSRAHRPFPRALRCDPWWTIRGTGEPLEPIFAELIYGLEATGCRDIVRRRPHALEWGPAIGIASRRRKRTAP